MARITATNSEHRPYAWWSHARDLAVPSGVWTPLVWNSPSHADPFNMQWYDTSSLQTTTIAVGSNGAVLPQNTINVASTTGFASSGWLTITGPPGANIDTVVSYTGVTSTTFTGCNTTYHGLTAAGISTGTLATGQTVTQANVEHDNTGDGGYGLAMDICEAAFADIPTTSYIAIRNKNYDAFFNFAGATVHAAGINLADPGQHIQVMMQPALGVAGGSNRYEVYQNSGSVKYVISDGIQSPSLMKAYLLRT